MDLKQEVSLSALKRGKAPAYPVKTSINLVDTQQQRGNLLAQLGLFAIALVLIGVFAKFAVVDPLAASAASSNEVSAAQARLDVLAADRARMKAELEALGEDGTLPVVAVYDNIRNELNELNALMGGATTYNLSFAQPTVEDKLVRREVTVSFTVPDYAAALDVVRKLENGTYRCEITDFSVIGDMLADGTVDSVDAVLTVTYLETTNGAATTAGLVEKAK